MTEIQIHNVEKPQPGAESKPPDISNKIFEAAQLEVGGGYTARVAAQVVENSDFARQLFPGHSKHAEDERNSAYRYLMHKEGVAGYPNYPNEGDAPLSKETMAKLDNYLKDHPNPKMNVTKVEKEAAVLRDQGFPTPQLDMGGSGAGSDQPAPAPKPDAGTGDAGSPGPKPTDVPPPATVPKKP